MAPNAAFWSRELARTFYLYLLVGVAFIPWGVVYTLLILAGWNRLIVAVPVFGGALLTARFLWTPIESDLYSDIPSLYDQVVTKNSYSRFRRIIRTLNIPPGARVLEVGVGTGPSFPAYPRHCEVIGIDLAPDMLARAQEKIRENGWTHLKVLEMDALNLEFPDDSFDYVMAFHVVTVVPDPVRMIEEAKRVCRPGGRIVIVNHFASNFPLLGFLTEMLDPVTRRLGWRSNLRLRPFIEATELMVEKAYELSRLSLYTVLVARNKKNDWPKRRKVIV